MWQGTKGQLLDGQIHSGGSSNEEANGLNAPASSGAEPQKIIMGWNPTEKDYPRDKCIHHLFEEQVERDSGAVALVFEGLQITYGELNDRANAVARALRTAGAGPGALVAIFVERSVEMMAGLLGILKTGGAYVPIDPDYPAERIAYMLANVNPLAILTLEKLRGRIATAAPSIICLDQLLTEPAGDPEMVPPARATCEDLAYVIYTSGSTGRPKGAMLPHRAVVSYLSWMQERFPLTPDDAVLQKAPISFDASVWELFLPLAAGARLVLAGREEHRDPACLVDLVQREQVTIAQFVPSLLEWFLEQPRVTGCVSLRRVFAGGEALPMELCRRFHNRLPVELVNLYGPTETAVYVSYWICNPADTRPLAPIGQPVSRTQLYILDETLHPVPPGGSGELFIGGNQVGAGYWNDPERTTAKFIPNSLESNPAARLYRTGDHCRRGPDGNFEFLGRLDDQIKIRGFRVELGEIEAALREHPGVSACAVAAPDSAGGGKTLVAYLTGREFTGADIEALRQWLGAKLPAYMLPTRFVSVKALPLNHNGKLDRNALAKLGGAELTRETGQVAPRDKLEGELAEIWQSLLRRPRVGIRDNFFDCGGQSLLAIVVCSQVYNRLNFELPLRWIFDCPTIESLAQRITSRRGSGATANAIAKAARQKPAPMSFGQQQMWLLQPALADPATYNVAIACRLQGRVDPKRIRTALSKIMRRHEVLRTGLVSERESLIQQIGAFEAVGFPWQEIDLATEPVDEREAAATDRLEAWVRRAFDLAHSPLWRALWIGLDENEQVLAFTFHHAIIDEWSLHLFLGELEQLYAAADQNDCKSLPILPVQYADYAVWQRRHGSATALEPHREYWRNQLRDLPYALEILPDTVRPSLPTGRGAVCDFQIAAPVATALGELARREKTTVFTVALAAFQLWLWRYTGQEDVIVGTPVTQRDRPELQNLLGYFVNTLPIRARIDGKLDFPALLRTIRESVLAAFDHAALPFEQMVEVAVRDRSAGRHPIYQVMFVLQEESLPAVRFGETNGRFKQVPTQTSKCDLVLTIDSSGPEWNCQFEYPSDLFSGERVAGMARHFRELLHSIVETPEKPIGRLNLLPAAERWQILKDWNDTKRDYPRDKCVHQLFEDQASRTPEATAVRFADKSLTYRELNIRANGLAKHLRSLGVESEVIVGLCVERSLEMVVSLLGILKAGGAYLPLSPTPPNDRLAFCLQESKARVLITQRLFADRFQDAPAGLRVVFLEDVVSGSAMANPARASQATDLAYVMYTSGSSGLPKGVAIEHRNVASFLHWVRESFDDEELSGVLAATSITFDLSVFEIFGPLSWGGIVILARDIMDWGDFCDTGKVRLVNTVPSLMATLIKMGRVLPGVKTVNLAGEALPTDLVDAIYNEWKVLRVNDLYGPTETTTYSTWTPRQRGEPASIGSPLANTQVYILDENLEPAPVGVAGELCLGGAGVARGYLHRPELTAEKFVPDPFGGVANARLYRTGDIARWRPDGKIIYLGRADHQVKIRGFRIELGEIEASLRAQPEILEAVVVMRENKSRDKNLTAYLVAKASARLDATTLRARLAVTLPDYMLPATYVWLEKIPLNANGKVDRKALPEPAARGGANYPVTLPVNLLEWELIRIWRRLFQRDDIGRQDDFFALGGHSLMAARLAAEIDKLLGCKLPIATLFQSPTIELLASRFAQENWAPPWSSLVPLQPRGSKPPLFFVHGVFGDVYVFVELVRLLDPDQPCFGIQAVGLDDKTPRHTTVEEMVDHYVKEIVSFQTEGPFYLVGSSLGGVFAYEVAYKLRQMGREVAMLVLLETGATGGTPWFFYGLAMATYLPGRCWHHLREWTRLSFTQKIKYFRDRLAALRNLAVENRAKPVMVTAPPPPGSPPPQFPAGMDYYHAVALPHKLRPYPGTLDFFEGDESTRGWRWYWRYLARGGATFHRMHGPHHEVLFQPYVVGLAKSISEVLQRKQAQNPAGPPGVRQYVNRD